MLKSKRKLEPALTSTREPRILNGLVPADFKKKLPSLAWRNTQLESSIVMPPALEVATGPFKSMPFLSHTSASCTFHVPLAGALHPVERIVSTFPARLSPGL